jgi:hypothetical protein
MAVIGPMPPGIVMSIAFHRLERLQGATDLVLKRQRDAEAELGPPSSDSASRHITTSHLAIPVLGDEGR